MTAEAQPTQNLGKRETSTVTGSSVKRLFASGSGSGNSVHRTAVYVCNHDGTSRLFVKLVAKNAALPTISGIDHDFAVQPGQTLCLPVGEGIDACILNSTGEATATNYTAIEAR
jgi:hypothetical protein